MAKEWAECPDCGSRVKTKNVERHMQDVHGKRAPKELLAPRSTPTRSRFAWIFPALIAIVLITSGSLAYVALFPANNPGDGNTPPEKDTVAVVTTNMGTFEILLYTGQAPLTTKNFIDLANDGFYDGLLFHRVEAFFVIQGGGFEPGMVKKESPFGTIPLETQAGLRNDRGTVAMARTDDPNSATSEFFVNLKANSNLDPQTSPPGYAVFGRVINGMTVVDAIGDVDTYEKSADFHVPVNDVVIQSVIIHVR